MCLLLVYFVSAAECHCFDLLTMDFSKTYNVSGYKNEVEAISYSALCNLCAVRVRMCSANEAHQYK